MKISKITQGYVLQTYDTETGKCESQEFIVGDECEYEVADTGEHFDVDDCETELKYQPYEMIQPYEGEAQSVDKLECKTQRKTFICSHCKSENIWFDAIMAWNKEKQEFQLEDLGKAFCNDCQGETTDKEHTL